MKTLQVEQYMTALGETVRYQPVTTIPTWELMKRVEALQNQLYELAAAAGIRVQTHVSHDWPRDHAELNLERVLEAIAHLEHATEALKLTVGLQRYTDLAFNEIHQSRLSNIWPDGKIHRGPVGCILHPEGYHKPVMTQILKVYNPPNLFEPKPLPEVTHDIESDGPIDLE